jgi:hypothetical protein
MPLTAVYTESKRVAVVAVAIPNSRKESVLAPLRSQANTRARIDDAETTAVRFFSLIEFASVSAL